MRLLRQAEINAYTTSFRFIFLLESITLAKEIMEWIERQFMAMNGLSTECPLIFISGCMHMDVYSTTLR